MRPGLAIATMSLVLLALAPSVEGQDRRRVVFVDEEGQVERWSVEEDAAGSNEADVLFLRGSATVPKLVDLFGGGGAIGVQLTDLTPELRRHLGAPEDAGVMVSRVLDRSPAERAGVRVGDILVSLDGERMGSSLGVRQAVRRHEAGSVVVVELWREGTPMQLDVEVVEREARALSLRALEQGGLELRPLSPLRADELGDLEGELTFEYHDAVGKMFEFFSSEDWRETVRGFEGLEWNSIGDRIEELEERLRELERQLELERSDGRR